MTLNSLYLFFVASLLLNLTPGNDMLFVASRSLSQGSRAGYFSALGILAGCFVHILAAIFGLSIIISKSAVLFEVIKYAGAAYLIYIGIKMLLTKNIQNISTKGLINQSNWSLFKQGTLTNALNPKVAIFFISFLPQFVNPQSPYVKIQLFTLGLWFAIQGTVVLLGVALVMGRTTYFLKQNPTFWLWQERITGIVLISLGIKLALTTRK